MMQMTPQSFWMQTWLCVCFCAVMSGSGTVACGQSLMPFADAVYVDPNYQVPDLDPYARPVESGPLFQKQSRTGFLQNLRHSTTVVSASEDHLGIVEYDFSASGAVPLFTTDAPLVTTPFFGIDSLHQDTLDLPDTLYEATFEFRHIRPFTESLTGDFAIKPGVFGDIESGASEFRLQGKAAGIWKQSPTTSWVLGITYLDRQDIDLLPIAGVLWHPNDAWKVDLVFPAPKVSVRAWRDCRSAWWLYTAGEFGGGSWGIERLDGSQDIVTIRDIRLRVGIEREAQLASMLLEAGYVFGRELEYGTGVGNTELDGAAMARVGIYY